MLIKGKDVIGLNIVTIDTGSVIETVQDVAYNPTSQRIEALFVRKAGLFGPDRAIHINDVKNIGEDAAIVADASVIRAIKELPEIVTTISKSHKYLVNTKVLTIEGKALGRVSDVLFDSKTGYVDSMEVSQGGLKTLTEGKKSIKPIDIVTIGADATIVSAFTELKLEAQGEQGGLNGVINDTKDKVADFSDSTKEATQDLAARAGKTTRQMRKNAKKTSEELLNAATDAYEDTKSAAEKTVRDVQRNGNVIAGEITEKTEDVKEITTEKVNSLRRDGRKMVSRSQEAVKNTPEELEIETTKIVRKK